MPGFPRRYLLGVARLTISPDLEGPLAWRADFVGGPG